MFFDDSTTVAGGGSRAGPGAGGASARLFRGGGGGGGTGGMGSSSHVVQHANRGLFGHGGHGGSVAGNHGTYDDDLSVLANERAEAESQVLLQQYYEWHQTGAGHGAPGSDYGPGPAAGADDDELEPSGCTEGGHGGGGGGKGRGRAFERPVRGDADEKLNERRTVRMMAGTTADGARGDGGRGDARGGGGEGGGIRDTEMVGAVHLHASAVPPASPAPPLAAAMTSPLAAASSAPPAVIAPHPSLTPDAAAPATPAAAIRVAAVSFSSQLQPVGVAAAGGGNPLSLLDLQAGGGPTGVGGRGRGGGLLGDEDSSCFDDSPDLWRLEAPVGDSDGDNEGDGSEMGRAEERAPGDVFG